MKAWVNYVADRNSGMTFQEIADKYGVSRQAVHSSYYRHGTPNHNFNPKVLRGIVYPNIRTWMMSNGVTIAEFLRRLGYLPHTNNSTMLSKVLHGNREPRKEFIDKMIVVTGMPYEKLFAKQ